MTSAAEAELGALFLNCQDAVTIRITIEEMGHSQPPTPVQVDNSTALGITTATVCPSYLHVANYGKRSKLQGCVI